MHPNLEYLIFDRFARNFDHAGQGFLLAHRDTYDETASLTEKLELLLKRKPDRLGHGTAPQGFEIRHRQTDFPLHRLLPGLMDAAIDRKSFDQPKLRHLVRGQLARGRF